MAVQVHRVIVQPIFVHILQDNLHGLIVFQFNHSGPPVAGDIVRQHISRRREIDDIGRISREVGGIHSSSTCFIFILVVVVGVQNRGVFRVLERDVVDGGSHFRAACALALLLAGAHNVG